MTISNYLKGHKIDKSLGQVFIKDETPLESITKIINPKRYQKAIEVGPGLGSLTYNILENLESLSVVEVDYNLTLYLVSNPRISSNINVIQKDILKTNLKELSLKLGSPLRIVGNVPYNISSFLIAHLLTYIEIIYDVHLVLQKEAAERLAANPNNKAYGRLSIITQFSCKVTLIKEISSLLFVPKPNVDSFLIKLKPRLKGLYSVFNKDMFLLVVKLAFIQRRKTVINSLKDVFNRSALIKSGFNIYKRAANVSIREYCTLSNLLVHKKLLENPC